MRVVGFLAIATIVAASEEKTGDIFEEETPSETERQGRAIFARPPSVKSECGGTVFTLNAGEATVLKSHKSFGHRPYPANYQCRFLVIPGVCDLNIVCSMDTASSGRSGSCEEVDHLRVIGLNGTFDSSYCGSRGPSLRLTGDDPLTLDFQSGDRDQLQRFGVSFGGFTCKVVCEERDQVTVAPATTTTTTSAPTDTLDEKEDDEEAVIIENPSSKCKCGVSSPRDGRIVCPPGEDCTSAPDEHPWQAGFVWRGKANPWCGGTVINDRYILTAAHCFKNKAQNKIQVVLGEYDWTTKSEGSDVRLNIDRIIRHPKFGSTAPFDYDYALVRLSRPIRFSTKIAPACLPLSDRDLTGSRGVTTGWGITDPDANSRQAAKLQEVAVNVVSGRRCRSSYSLGLVTPSMFCAAAAKADACSGDSGGPFVVRRGGRAVVEGVVSWGRGCAQAQWPGVYSKVAHVLNWIKENTRDAEYCSLDQRSVFGFSNLEHSIGRGDRRAA